MPIVRLSQDGRELKALIQLDAACFERAWPVRLVLEELQHPKAVNLAILGENGSLKAAILSRLIVDEHWIMRIMTHPQFRRQAFATQLIRSLTFEVLCLEVGVDNRSAIDFYTSLGFHKIGQRLKYYQGHENAWIMRLCRTSSSERFA